MTHPEIEEAVAALGCSECRRAVFAAIYHGRKATKTVSDIVQATPLNRKQVLTSGKRLARAGLVEQVKKEGETAYAKLEHYAPHKDRILREAVRSPSRRTRPRALDATRPDTRRPPFEKKPPPACRGRPIEVFDCCSLHPKVRQVCRSLVRSGHHAEAVEAGLKLYNNSVKDKAGRPKTPGGDELDGASLMTHVFSPRRPLLRINEMRTRSDEDEQTGYMQLAQGAMTGLRNPRAHEHDRKDDPGRARELIGLVSYLMRRLDDAKRTRRRRRP